jgi:hypothetical protein
MATMNHGPASLRPNFIRNSTPELSDNSADQPMTQVGGAGGSRETFSVRDGGGDTFVDGQAGGRMIL